MVSLDDPSAKCMLALRQEVQRLTLRVASLEHEFKQIHMLSQSSSLAGSPPGEREPSKFDRHLASLEAKCNLDNDNIKPSNDAHQDKEGIAIFPASVDAVQIEIEQPATVSQQMVSDFCKIGLEKSVWDLILFWGLPASGTIGSIWISILVVFNAAIEVVICCALQFVFNTPEDFRSASIVWRASAGHSHLYASALGESMASRLCNDDGSLTLAGMQTSEIKAVSSYLDSFGFIAIGPLMCTLMLAVWFLCQYDEVLKISDHVLVLAHMPRSNKTRLSWTGEAFRFETFSCGRCVWVGIGLFLRLGLVILVAISGTVWLAHTKEVEDIIVNAVALSFVMTIDKLVYETASPVALKTLAAKTEPLRILSPNNLRAMSLRPMMTFSLGFMYVTILYLTYVSPEWSGALQMQDAMCGGDTNLIVGANPSTGVVFAFRGEHFDVDVFNEKARGNAWSLSERVTTSLTRGKDSSEQYWVTSWRDFKEKQSLSLNEYVNEFGACSDNTSMPVQSAVRSHLKDPNWASCLDLSEEQCALGHPILRIACPIRCGCAEPVFGSFSVEGCPLALCRQTEKYQQKLSNMGIHDMERAVLEATPAWHSYWASFDVVLNENPNTLATFSRLTELKLSMVITIFKQRGCGALADLMHQTSTPSLLHSFFCSQSSRETPRRPLSPFCPESCRCSELESIEDSIFCPLSPAPSQTKACMGIEVVLLDPALESSCEDYLPNHSNSTGFYSCHPHMRNGKNVYTYTDVANVVWEIRWEKEMDWGGMFLGADAGLGGQPKWTLSSRAHPKAALVRHQFAISNSSTPPSGRWLQRISYGESQQNCSTGITVIKEVIGEWTMANRDLWATGQSCDDICMSSGLQCTDTGLASRAHEVDDLEEMSDVLSGLEALSVSMPGTEMSIWQYMQLTGCVDDPAKYSLAPLILLNEGVQCILGNQHVPSTCAVKSEPWRPRLCFCHNQSMPGHGADEFQCQRFQKQYETNYAIAKAMGDDTGDCEHLPGVKQCGLGWICESGR